MGKLAPERFEVVFLYKNRRGFFFGNKILGWIDHLSPGARLTHGCYLIRGGKIRLVGATLNQEMPSTAEWAAGS